MAFQRARPYQQKIRDPKTTQTETRHRHPSGSHTQTHTHALLVIHNALNKRRSNKNSKIYEHRKPFMYIKKRCFMKKKGKGKGGDFSPSFPKLKIKNKITDKKEKDRFKI